MPEINMLPLAGMNTVAEDAALQRRGDAPSLSVRDALNVNITPAGKAVLRDSPSLATSQPIKHLWQSPLHGDVFGVLLGEWVKVDTSDWSATPLAFIGSGDTSHAVLNNLVCVSGPAGIFCYDGSTARRLAIDTPPSPLVIAGSGSLPAGTYAVAMAWLRGDLESATSPSTKVEVDHNGALSITMPLVMDASITGVRLYMTRQNGGELARIGDYPTETPSVAIVSMPSYGAPAIFRNMSAMPTGQHLRLWRGRLLTARANILRFSEPMAYHIHDELHGFVQMPQRITFVEPVDGGIWVGQVDHVAFLSGAHPRDLVRKASSGRAPVPGSAVAVDSDLVGADLSQGGEGCVLWLSENGYVLGTPSGQIVELHAGALKGITAIRGTSVVLDRRVLTAVT